jgi:hypothetical protein
LISGSNSTALSGQVLDRSVEIIPSTARHRTSPSEGGHAGLKFKERRLPSRRYPLRSIFSSTHYGNFAQATLYHGFGFDTVWRSFTAVAAIGFVFFTAALVRFRRTAR